MSIVERSINSYRKLYQGFLGFTLLTSLIITIVLMSYEKYKLMGFMLPFFIFWMSIPLFWYYKNWKTIEKNKSKLEKMNITEDGKTILSLKSIFTKI